jgi:hypothetical protein
MWHRRLGIQFGGPRKQPRCFVVIEAVDQRETLIEEFLRQVGLCSDRMFVGAKAVQQFRGLRIPGYVIIMLRQRNGNSKQSENPESVHMHLPMTGVAPYVQRGKRPLTGSFDAALRDGDCRMGDTPFGN